MRQKKKNDIAALLDYAGSHRGLTFLGLGLSAASMVCSMIPYLCIWLAAPGSDCRGTQLDGSAERCQVRVAGLRDRIRWYCAVLRGADVYPSGSLPHSGQHP